MTRSGFVPVAVAIGLAVTTLAARPPVQQDPQAIFRSGTNLVTVDVAVHQDGRPVAGLTAQDFVVTDNKVQQRVDAFTVERLPVNVTLLVDTSSSMTGVAAAVAGGLRDAAGFLSDDDRVRLLVFASDATQVFPFQSPRAAIPLAAVRPDPNGSTSLYDALATGLIRQRPPDRGELVVAFTDGIDTTSSLNVKRIQDIARRSEAVLHAFVVRSSQLIAACARAADNLDARPWLCDQSDLRGIAETTGGRMYETTPGKHIAEGLRRALDDFRASYTLRYTLTGTPRPGWHDIVVKVARPGKFTVRARRGYLG